MNARIWRRQGGADFGWLATPATGNARLKSEGPVLAALLLRFGVSLNSALQDRPLILDYNYVVIWAIPLVMRAERLRD